MEQKQRDLEGALRSRRDILQNGGRLLAALCSRPVADPKIGSTLTTAVVVHEDIDVVHFCLATITCNEGYLC